ncbi:MAG: hypothetical protein DLM53_05805 [Candidatus Eremiobacter antarcticus]|nr:plasmid pRiA4b ORF-3 family protein [Candidatus Eremiobacteraeota bacterium]PZR62333.1 MAG: hypothetical protein DLM53_05805 [Candidatus Eremiobacter sp. RRmetagenome_bin22]
MTKNSLPIYELKISLDDVSPIVWRRFCADPKCSLPLLHLILQRVMGWENRHLHYFQAHGVKYAPSSAELQDGAKDERRYRLVSLVKLPGESFTYTYDFGDWWRHTVELEGTLERSRSLIHPKCVSGENACPPEDVGGPHGYRKLQVVLANPTLEGHMPARQWVGTRFDPSEFDLQYQNLGMWHLRGSKLSE